jgi:outer membrane biogenesis lipoprotein LolB
MRSPEKLIELLGHFMPRAMRTVLLIVLLSLLVGCASTPSPQVQQAARKYQAVNRWMTRDDIYQLLGQPQSTLADGRQQWRFSDQRYGAELLLRLSPDGTISEMEQHFPLQ